LGSNRLLGRGSVVVDGARLSRHALVLRVKDLNGIGHGVLGTHLASGIVGEHNLNLDADDTLAKHDVANSEINVLLPPRQDRETMN
jgi:hypothetical protein